MLAAMLEEGMAIILPRRSFAICLILSGCDAWNGNGKL